MTGLALFSHSMYEIMKMYGGIFLYSNPLGNYEQSKFFLGLKRLSISAYRLTVNTNDRFISLTIIDYYDFGP